jgi:hypothetical protein
MNSMKSRIASRKLAKEEAVTPRQFFEGTRSAELHDQLLLHRRTKPVQLQITNGDAKGAIETRLLLRTQMIARKEEFPLGTLTVSAVKEVTAGGGSSVSKTPQMMCSCICSKKEMPEIQRSTQLNGRV